MRREHRDYDLSNAGVQRADAVVVLGLDEMTTVRVALTVEEMNPSARIVLELDNPAFGRRLSRPVGCRGWRHPAFAAAALGRSPETVVPVGRRVVILAELEARRSVPVGALHKPGQLRILAHHRDGRWSWHPRRAELLQPGDLVAVAQPGRAWRRPAEPWGSDATSPGRVSSRGSLSAVGQALRAALTTSLASVWMAARCSADFRDSA